jgi:hypothetical protein
VERLRLGEKDGTAAYDRQRRTYAVHSGGRNGIHAEFSHVGVRVAPRSSPLAALRKMSKMSKNWQARQDGWMLSGMAA